MVTERTPRAALAGLAAMAAAHATIQAGVIGLSVVGVGVGPAAAATVLALAGLAGAVSARWCLPPRTPGADPSSASWLVLPWLLAAGAVWCAMLLLAARRPVYDWDGLYYHLPAIDAWVRAGRIHWIEGLPDVPFVNGYPMGVEAFDFLLVQLTGSSRWLDAGNLAFWPLGAFGLVVTAARCGARGGWAWSAAAGLAGIPMLVAQSATAYVDAAHACCVMGAFGAAAWLLERAELRRAVLLGLCLGLAVATKGTGVLVAVVLGAVLFLMMGRAKDGERPAREILATVALVAFLVCGFWFLRNLMHTGNPFHPVGVRVLGHTLFDGVDARAHTLLNLPGWLAVWPAWLRPVVSWTQPDAPIRGYGAISGLGTLWLWGGLPACLALLAWAGRRRRPLPPAASMLLVTAVLVLMLQPAPWWGRFTLWLHAAGLPLLAAVLQRLWDARHRGLSAVAMVWVVLLSVSAGREVLQVLEGGADDGRADDAYLNSIEYVFPRLPSVAPAAWEAPRLARSAFGRWGTLLGGGLSQPVGSREVRVIGADTRPRELFDEGYRWILWDVVGAGPVPAPLLAAASERHDYAPAPDRHFVLLSLRDPPPDLGR